MKNNHINELIKKFVSQGYSIRKIANEIGMSYSAIRHRLNFLNLKTLSTPQRVFQNGETLLACKICGFTLTGLQTKFCSDKCRMLSSSHKFQGYASQKKRAIERKRTLIEKMGGKCEICGYSKNQASLCFHHKDSENKSFGLDSRHLSNSSQNRIDKEARKCKLLCLNCHGEYHNPELFLNLD